MSIFGAISIGLIVGFIAKLMNLRRDSGGWIATIFLGLAGSLIAGFLGAEFGWYQNDEPAGLLASMVGAILLLFLYQSVMRRRA